MKAQAILLASAALVTAFAGNGVAFAQIAPGDQVVANAVAHPQNWPKAHSPAALTDAATEARIDELLSRMTLRQKVGQLVQADISTATPADLATYPVGSVLAGGNSGPLGNERASAADWDRLVGEFRAASWKAGSNGVAIPIIFGVDAVHGHNNLPSATIFPHNVGLGAARDPDLIRRIGAATAAEIAGSGIEWTFAPTLAVPQDVRWGRSYEGYSSDPAIVTAYGRAMVEGLQGPLVAGREIALDKVAATAKHFLADGGTAGGKDQGDARISESELVLVHAQGYPAAIDAGALTVMASFSSWNGVKNHGNRSLLTDVLKDRMGFGGFVVGDWNGHGQVAGCSITSCPAAINAGLDMFMAPDGWKALFDNTLKQAEEGVIPAARLDDAVRRILRVKFKLGLMDPKAKPRRDYAAVGSPSHLDLAREAVAKSLVLLKNEGRLLPIRPGAKVLIAGPGANDMAMQSGGWTISWQGTDVTAADFPNGQTIGRALSKAVTDAGGQASIAAAGDYAQKPDVAVVVFGEKPYAEFQGDVPTLAYQPAGATDLALIRKLKAQGIPVVAFFLSGRPMFTSPIINAADAFVAGWLPGTQGAGVADVLVAGKQGKPVRDFSGRLSFAWPKDAKSPITDPLFPVGYGLSYAAPASLGTLSEDPGIDVAAALNVENFFAAGRTQAPWQMNVADAGGARPAAAGPTQSPNRAVSVSPVDVNAQEDARKILWTDAGIFSIDGPTADLSRQLGNAFALRLDWRIDSRDQAPVKVGMGYKPLDISAWVKTAPVGQMTTLRIPMRCFADAGVDFSQLGNALRIEAGGGFGVTLLSARVEAVGDNPSCPR